MLCKLAQCFCCRADSRADTPPRGLSEYGGCSFTRASHFRAPSPCVLRADFESMRELARAGRSLPPPLARELHLQRPNMYTPWAATASARGIAVTSASLVCRRATASSLLVPSVLALPPPLMDARRRANELQTHTNTHTSLPCQPSVAATTPATMPTMAAQAKPGRMHCTRGTKAGGLTATGIVQVVSRVALNI